MHIYVKIFISPQNVSKVLYNGIIQQIIIFEIELFHIVINFSYYSFQIFSSFTLV